MIVFSKEEDEVLEIPVGVGPFVAQIDASLKPLTVDSSTVQQVIYPELGCPGFNKVTVNPYEYKALDKIINARAGISTDLTGTVFPDVTRTMQYFSILGVPAGYGTFTNDAAYGSLDLSGITNVTTRCFFYAFTRCVNIDSVDLSGISVIDAAEAFDRAFNGAGIKSVDLSRLSEIYGQGACYYMFANTPLEGHLDLSSLKYIGRSGDNVPCAGMFYQTNVTSVDLSGLEYVNGYDAVESMFGRCDSLEYVDLSSLGYVSDYNRYMFSNCPNLWHVKGHSKAFYMASSTFSHGTASHITLIEFSNHPLSGQGDVDLRGLTALNAQSVYNVLSACYDAWAPGHFGTQAIIFDEGGITVTDFEDGRIQAEYDRLANSGKWVIRNLTVLPYGS